RRARRVRGRRRREAARGRALRRRAGDRALRAAATRRRWFPRRSAPRRAARLTTLVARALPRAPGPSCACLVLAPHGTEAAPLHLVLDPVDELLPHVVVRRRVVVAAARCAEVEVTAETAALPVLRPPVGEAVLLEQECDDARRDRRLALAVALLREAGHPEPDRPRAVVGVAHGRL